MKKNGKTEIDQFWFIPKKTFFVMRLTAFIFLISTFSLLAGGSYSQNTRISLNLKNVQIKEVLQRIEDNTEFFFIYNNQFIDVEKTVSISVEKQNVLDVLNQIFTDQQAEFQVTDRKIVIAPSFMSGVQSSTKVTGKVADSSGSPLPGVSVVIKGTTTGTITDSDGNYSLGNVPENATLQFSFVGMKAQEVLVSGKSNVNVVLIEEAIGIEEVVAVGYGTQKKANVTGAVASANGEDLAKRPVTNAGTMLQGIMPGLQVTQDRGEPGSVGLTLRIRGQGTFSSAGNDPLVLVDGVQGNIQDLDPSVIESVSVLKDAASASIYGAKAANGVILVTTKSGSSGKLQIEYSGNYGVYTPTKLFDMVNNSAQYMELWNEAKANNQQTAGLTTPATGLYPQATIDLYRNATDRVKYPNFDWVHAGINSAPTQTHNLSFNGSTGVTRYNIALGLVDEQGTMVGFNYKRYTGRINLSSQVKNVKFGTNISLKNGDREAYRSGSQEQFLSLLAQAPTYTPQLSDGSGHWTYKTYDFEYNNKNTFAVSDPVTGALRHTIDYALTSQLWADVTIMKGLTWYTKGAFNLNASKWSDFGSTVQQYWFSTGLPSNLLDVGGKGRNEQYDINSYLNLYSYLNFERSFGIHTVKAQVGYSQEANTYQFQQAARTTYVTDALKELNAGSNAVMSNSGNKEEWALQSLFGRLNYGYKDRYLLEANLRYDGTSRLSKDTRWGIFPSFSAGWRVTEEQFIKNLGLAWLDNFKIRGSWGQLGNQNIGLYPYQALLGLTGNYSFDNTVLSSGVAQQALNNENIKWETTTSTDFGFDLTVFKGLTANFDWYDRTTTNILRASQVTNLVGLTAPTVNNGTVQNKGVELGISYTNSIKSGALKGLSYYGGASFEHYNNKLTKFGAREISGYRLREEGRSWDTYYMLEWVGIFQNADEVKAWPKQYADPTLPGDLKYKDQLTIDTNNDGIPDKADGIVNDNDRIPMGGNLPKLNYSFNLGASWKAVDVSLQFQGVAGVKFFCNDWGMWPFKQGSAPTTMWLDRWTPTNPSQTMPRITWGQNSPSNLTRNSSWYLMDGAYLRLKNLSIGYTIPSILTKKAGIEKLRVYFAGDNLLTFTKFPGLDPERQSTANVYAQYPQNKIISFGVNITL